jgi:hypothetical protein
VKLNNERMFAGHIEGCDATFTKASVQHRESAS